MKVDLGLILKYDATKGAMIVIAPTIHAIGPTSAPGRTMPNINAIEAIRLMMLVCTFLEERTLMMYCIFLTP